LLFDITTTRKFLCYTIEDEYRSAKVQGETRVPAGTYKIKLRTVGGFHTRYKDLYSFHKGMLHVQDVPGFEFILIHTGNTDNDTDGCLLIGDSCHENITGEGLIGASVIAYKRIYPLLVNTILANKELTIKYTDFDNVK
jgi:hypothetical protein